MNQGEWYLCDMNRRPAGGLVLGGRWVFWALDDAEALFRCGGVGKVLVLPQPIEFDGISPTITVRKKVGRSITREDDVASATS